MKLWHAEDGENYERLYKKQHLVSEKEPQKQTQTIIQLPQEY
jgi:hypothetical protein